MSLRDELLGTEEPEPRGFTLLVPPTWERLTIDDAGRARLEAIVRDRGRLAGRPDLDGRMRPAIRAQWRRLAEQRALAMYMPVAPSIEGAMPITIAIVPWAARAGSMAEDVAARVPQPVTTFETGAGDALRWVEEVDGAPAELGLEGLDGVRSRHVNVVYPFPHADARRGALLRAAILHPGIEEAGQALVGFTELVDGIARTFRWRM